MQRGSIADEVRAQGVNIPEDGPAINAPEATPAAGPTAAGPSVVDRLVSFFSRRSPDTDLATYEQHPLNWRRDPEGRQGAGQMIRAAEGWAGQGLNLCIVDLIMGWIRLRRADATGGGVAGGRDTAGTGPE